MNLLDYIIIITMIYLILKGALRGFIREVSSLSGVILGIWLGVLFQPKMTGLLSPYLPFTDYLPLISFAVLFSFILISCNIIGWIIKLLFKKALLGWADRLIGAGFAIVKGVIIIYLVMVMLTFFIPAKTPLIAGSKLAPWIIKSYQSMISMISPDHYRKWKKRMAGGRNILGEIVSEKIKDAGKKHE